MSNRTQERRKAEPFVCHPVRMARGHPAGWTPGGASATVSFPVRNPLHEAGFLGEFARRRRGKCGEFACGGRPHTVEVVGSNPTPPILSRSNEGVCGSRDL